MSSGMQVFRYLWPNLLVPCEAVFGNLKGTRSVQGWMPGLSPHAAFPPREEKYGVCHVPTEKVSVGSSTIVFLLV